MTAVVIGLGPAGTIVSRVLASAGVSVIAFQPSSAAHERNPLVSPTPTLRRTAAETAVLAPAPQQGADRLGGSKHLAAPQSYRLDEGAFHPCSDAIRHGIELPADADVVDWPVSSDQLAPYYRRIERILCVRPLPETEWTARMRRGATTLSFSPFDAPAAASHDVSQLRNHSLIRVVNATVTTIRTDRAGAVSGVDFTDAAGSLHSLRCDAVVVAGAVIPSIRLLLLSGISANGLVGRSLMSHNSFAVHGYFPGTDLQRESAGPATAVAVSEFEADRFDHAGLGFTGGSVLQAAMTGPHGPAWRASVAASMPAVLGGADPAAWVSANAASIGSVWAQPDQLPRPANRVDLDPHHTDAHSRPVPRVTFDIADDDHLRWRFLADRMAQWLTAAGASITWAAPLEAQPLGTHLYGGVRMGHDPGTSVVDSYGRSHEVAGLTVVGSSTFPSTGGRGPVQTIEALAWRAAERLTRDARSR